MKKLIEEIKQIYEESYLLPSLTIFCGSVIFVYIMLLLASIRVGD